MIYTLEFHDDETGNTLSGRARVESVEEAKQHVQDSLKLHPGIVTWKLYDADRQLIHEWSRSSLEAGEREIRPEHHTPGYDYR